MAAYEFELLAIDPLNPKVGYHAKFTVDGQETYNLVITEQEALNIRRDALDRALAHDLAMNGPYDV